MYGAWWSQQKTASQIIFVPPLPNSREIEDCMDEITGTDLNPVL